MIATLTNTAARHLFLHRHGLITPASGTGKGADLHSVIADLGFVQLDSVNTLARAHDLILWSRRQQYRVSHLPPLLQRDRAVFEHWTHDASAIDMAHFPHWRLKMARDGARLAGHWQGIRRDDFTQKVDAVLRRVADHGDCTSSDVGEGEERGKGGWWDWHPSKTALEYLWRSGQLSVTRRDGFRKVYDLTERVIPQQYLNARYSKAETIDWACNAALDRLGFATSGEIAAFWDIVTVAEARDWCAAAMAHGEIMQINVEGADGSLRKCFARPDIMDVTPPAPSQRIRLLSPFDPALRDRKRAERLFGFHYRIEIFVPAPKRRYGYYVFPVLEGTQLIGRIDTKRDGDTLRVTAFWPEDGVRMGAGRSARLVAEIERAARFVGSAQIDYARGWAKESS
ncbi:winged helix-turn-helix domain-containing protein [Octadecabacter sp. SW4]|uniref:winged helix-turn-helix domain-containing protein n=1 Tax=Octadecabacter sp. SW4 TaxID=2602067 RepID=UPI0011C1E5F4|nr:crosslink repair DNA glycosylase YcaQ family protein [Octadecabacter sp. SW4]QEE34366.1 winged helix-turn-helix domain-containing protein [Octadecabacter sp. SW4]